MAALERYLAAATRKNTQKSYAQATRHFEQEFGGFLPATGDAIARYLAQFAGALSNNTLRQRLAALARWHQQHGFPDPTRAEVVRQAFRGIRAVHSAPEKQAAPLQLAHLDQVDSYCQQSILSARESGDRRRELQAVRDRALVRLGFWRAFRSDDLVRLRVEHLGLRPGSSMQVFLSSSKGDRQNEGRTWQVPALSRLCPVEGMAAWLKLAGLTEGPVFRRVTRWGSLGRTAMNSGSVIPLLRSLLANAGVDQARLFSSHSLRRGFATWASANGWDLKTLMQYVGWQDVQSAARYLEAATNDQERIERGLTQSPAQAASPTVEAASSRQVKLEVALALTSFAGRTRGVKATIRHIEEICLARHHGQKFGKDGHRYRILMNCESEDGTLTERISELLDALHQAATNNECYLEASIKDVTSGQVWD